MGLFDKKTCDICGGKIGLLGNRKLEDGNLCKDCAAQLSPWFSERRSSTVSDIQAQLEYREANRERVEAFNATRTLGENYIVYLDEDKQQFLVSSAKNYRNDNPDVLDFSQVTGCDLEVDETKHEIYQRNAEGRNVSYNPARYDYSYDFIVHLRVNTPWFDEMKFRINSSSVQVKSGSLMASAPVGGMRPGMQQGGMRPGMQQGQRPGMQQGQRPGMQQGQRPGMQQGQRPIMQQRPFGMGQMSGSAAVVDPTTNADYQRYVAMGNEIKEIIMQVRQDARETIAAASVPKTAVTCPNCGASTIPDSNGCCEFCGSALGY